MATMVGLMKQAHSLVDETYTRKNEAEERRQLEYESALKIQAWYRGQKVRSYLKYLHRSATKIQSRWRGFLGRRVYRILVKNLLFVMKLNHYNRMATQIQKIWRGYYVRKYISNYYSRKRYLEGLVIKNEIIRSELNDWAEQQENKIQWKREAEERKRLEHFTRKNHYLVSTEVMPGIYNSPFLPYPQEMEFHLRNARPYSPKKEPLKMSYDPPHKGYNLPCPEPLPPIHPKQQGPFKEPSVVQKQRYKPFQPSLRVETDFTSLEKARETMKIDEWVTRLNDNIFVPFKKKGKHYEPLLHTTSKYGHLPYGTKFYREEFPDKHVTQPFKTLVPPIPILDKLNDTYSQGQV